MRWTTCLGIGIVAAGCAAPPAVPATEEASGVRIANHVAYPFELTDLWVVVDGRTMLRDSSQRHAIRDDGFVPIRFAPGVHRVDATAWLRMPCGLGGTMDYEVRTARAFEVGDAPASVSLDLFTHGPLTAFDHAPDVAFRLRGATEARLVEVALPRGFVPDPGDETFPLAPACHEWPELEAWAKDASAGR